MWVKPWTFQPSSAEWMISADPKKAGESLSWSHSIHGIMGNNASLFALGWFVTQQWLTGTLTDVLYFYSTFYTWPHTFQLFFLNVRNQNKMKGMPCLYKVVKYFWQILNKLLEISWCHFSALFLPCFPVSLWIKATSSIWPAGPHVIYSLPRSSLTSTSTTHCL